MADNTNRHAVLFLQQASLAFDVPRYLVGGSVGAGSGGHPAPAVYGHHADGVVSPGAGPGGGAAPCGRRPVPPVGAAALRRTRLHVLAAERATWLGISGIGAAIIKLIYFLATIIRLTFLVPGYSML